MPLENFATSSEMVVFFKEIPGLDWGVYTHVSASSGSYAVRNSDLIFFKKNLAWSWISNNPSHAETVSVSTFCLAKSQDACSSSEAYAPAQSTSDFLNTWQTSRMATPAVLWANTDEEPGHTLEHLDFIPVENVGARDKVTLKIREGDLINRQGFSW